MSKTIKKWSLPVHDVKADQADLSIYAQLYSVTAALAEPLVRKHIAFLRASAGAQLAVEDLETLQQFLTSETRPDDGEPPDGAVGKSTSPVFDFMREGLRRFIAEDAESTSKRLVKEVSDELASGVWSSLLAGIEHSSLEKKVPVSSIVPSLSGERDTDSFVDLGAAMVHIGMPSAVLINIVHQAMHKLLGMHAKQDYVQLPLRLRLAKEELFKFLDTQYGEGMSRSPDDKRAGLPAKSIEALLGERIRFLGESL